MSDPFAPPPRRPAPDSLHRRIETELKAASRRRLITPARVMAPIAAASVLIAGIWGANQLGAKETLFPADKPSTAATASPSPSGSAPTATDSPTTNPATPTSTDPEPFTPRKMTKAEISQDTKTCLAEYRKDPDPRAHGKFRATAGTVIPVLTYPIETTQLRMLALQDDNGELTCRDGQEPHWSIPIGEVASEKAPAVIDDGHSETSCYVGGPSIVQARLGVQVYDPEVNARVTLSVDGKVARTIVQPAMQGRVDVEMRISGPISHKPLAYQLEITGADGKTVPLRPWPNQKAEQTHSRELKPCWKSEVPETPGVARPTSDAAGLKKCLAKVKDYADLEDVTFRAPRAKAAVVVSDSQRWGAVVSDGDRYFGCSRYPTEEISELRRERGGPLTERALGWALMSIDEDSEALWAAGFNPGIESISYTLPNGTTIPGTISKDGHWMVMTGAVPGFSPDGKLDKAIKVKVVHNGETSTYRLKFNEATSCNQVSHGC